MIKLKQNMRKFPYVSITFALVVALSFLVTVNEISIIDYALAKVQGKYYIKPYESYLPSASAKGQIAHIEAELNLPDFINVIPKIYSVDSKHKNNIDIYLYTDNLVYTSENYVHDIDYPYIGNFQPHRGAEFSVIVKPLEQVSLLHHEESAIEGELGSRGFPHPVRGTGVEYFMKKDNKLYQVICLFSDDYYRRFDLDKRRNERKYQELTAKYLGVAKYIMQQTVLNY